MCVCLCVSFKSFGMSNESRNVLVVTFEDSAESVKVCVCVCGVLGVLEVV